MHHSSPEWITDELRAQFSKALGSLNSQIPAERCVPVSQAYIADRPFPGQDGQVTRTGSESGAHFGCPDCGVLLGVVNLPAAGPCPACGASLELSINAPRPWQRVAVWLPWMLTLLMILIILWGVILIGSRLGLGALDVESYDPIRDNRFESWPWSLRANPRCRIPTSSITGIGWDSRGGSHALVDPSFVVITHNTPPEKLHFSNASGEVFHRKVISQHTLSTDAAGLPWIRLCRLDRPLPSSIRPLPILNLSGHSTLDLPLFVVGRHGRIGSENSGSVDILYRASHVSDRLVTVGALQVPRKPLNAGDTKLRVGDSGTPLIAMAGNDICLVGVACAIMKNPEPGNPPDMHIHALLYPQLQEMRLAGAEPSAVSIASPDPRLYVNN